jgi:hypothetical protein
MMCNNNGSVCRENLKTRVFRNTWRAESALAFNAHCADRRRPPGLDRSQQKHNIISALAVCVHCRLLWNIFMRVMTRIRFAIQRAAALIYLSCFSSGVQSEMSFNSAATNMVRFARKFSMKSFICNVLFDRQVDVLCVNYSNVITFRWEKNVDMFEYIGRAMLSFDCKF